MTKVADIIDSARDSLADPRKERWSDERLIRLLDEGQKYAARLYNLLHGDSGVLLAVGQSIYPLASELLFIRRCTHEQKPIALRTYSEMDKLDADWMSREGGKIEAIVFNDRNLQEIRVYPTPDSSFPVEHLTMNSPFGVLVDLEGVTGAPFGVLTDIATTGQDNAVLASIYGVVSDGVYLEQMSIYYTRDPAKLTQLTDDLELPPMFDRALKLYVVGYAFSDDLDAQNQEKAARALAMLEKELAVLGTRARQHDGVSGRVSNIPYRGFA